MLFDAFLINGLWDPSQLKPHSAITPGIFINAVELTELTPALVSFSKRIASTLRKSASLRPSASIGSSSNISRAREYAIFATMRDLVLDLDLDLILAVVWILRESTDDLYDDTEKNDLELIQGEVIEQVLWTGRIAMRRIDVGKVT